MNLIPAKEESPLGRVVDKKAVKKRGKKLITRYGVVAGNIALILTVGFIVIQSQIKADNPIHSSAVSVADMEDVGVVDSIAASEIAATVAYVTDIPQIGEVNERAITLSHIGAFPAEDDVNIQKPQIITATGSGTKRDIQLYTVQPGDTVSALATRYNVTSDSIRWSNNLNSEYLTAGTQIFIPPHSRNGIVYRVVAGDTPQKLAEKYGTTSDKIISFNDAELSGLIVGDLIFIPDGKIATVSNLGAGTSYSLYLSRLYSCGSGAPGNTYDRCQCTWGAYNYRYEMGRPVPNNWGSAYSWDDYARAQGWLVDRNPEVGAVIQAEGGEGWAYIYHVGVVTEVVWGEYIVVKDMNYAGPGVETVQKLNWNLALRHDFIH